MFISKAEKDQIVASIKLLQEQVRDLTAKVLIMAQPPETKKKRTMSAENRAKLSAMMKKRHADKKAKQETKQ